MLKSGLETLIDELKTLETERKQLEVMLLQAEGEIKSQGINVNEMKKVFLFLALVLFITVGVLSYVRTVTYTHKEYIEEDRLINDIQNRLNNNSDNTEISYFEVLQQRDIENGRAILYEYTIDNIDFLACSVFERNNKNEFAFLNFSGMGSSFSESGLTARLKGNDGKYHSFFIHFGYIGKTSKNKYEIRIGEKTFIKEYRRGKYFMEPYSMDNGGVGIKPVKE
jgi:hypothetical protein